MPPLIEDEDVSDDEIPFKEPAVEEAKGEEKAESDDEGSEDEFVVEKILDHVVVEDGSILYQVVWQGYPLKKDYTWEPESNLATAKETLEEYFTKIGGRPGTKQKTVKKRKAREEVDSPKNGRSKKSRGSETPDAPASTTRKGGAKKAVEEWKPPPGSWEDHVLDIDTIEEVANEKTGVLERWAYVVWKEGNKSRHILSTVNRQAPQKMLQYYESHLVFKPTSDTREEDGEAAAET